MAKTKYLTKNEPKMDDFLYILIQKLKWLQPVQDGGKTLKSFFVSPEVYTQPKLPLRKGSQHFIFFRTP